MGGIVSLFFNLHSCGGSQSPVLIRRYPWNYVYIHYIHKMDDGTSTLITVITLDLISLTIPI